MNYVLDASIGACWVLRNPLMSKAVRLRDEYQRQIHQLIAPAHFPLEVANGLTKAESQKIIPVGDASLLIRDILNTPPILYPIDPLFYRAVEISSQTRSAFYDCLYVALAERERCELVTADLQLVNNLQGQFPFVVSLASLP
jgi:predicted nucleic acid-binding protein